MIISSATKNNSLPFYLVGLVLVNIGVLVGKTISGGFSLQFQNQLILLEIIDEHTNFNLVSL